jgi:hypothetical protein
LQLLGLKVVWWLITNDKGEDKEKGKAACRGKNKVKGDFKLVKFRGKVSCSARWKDKVKGEVNFNKVKDKVRIQIKFRVKLSLLKLKVKLE